MTNLCLRKCCLIELKVAELKSAAILARGYTLCTSENLTLKQDQKIPLFQSTKLTRSRSLSFENHPHLKKFIQPSYLHHHHFSSFNKTYGIVFPSISFRFINICLIWKSLFHFLNFHRLLGKRLINFDELFIFK